MRREKRRRSLTVQLILTMAGIVAGTVLVCWFFNNTFLERYYTYQKEKELLRGYSKVNQACREDSMDSGSFDITFETICANGNINILIMDPNGFLVRSSFSDAQRLRMKLDELVYGVSQGRITVLMQGEDYVMERQTDERLQSDFIVLRGRLDDGSFVYMRTALESIRESAAVTNRFFIMVSALAIVFSVLVIVIISRSISKPIQSLSGISRRMAKLDFAEKYHGSFGVSRELEELGQSVNELSETLEDTISELKSANISLRRDIEKREQIDEMRKEFLSNISHELKTPLALIQGYAEGLKECINDDAESRGFYCEVIMDESDKMNQMVRKLLTLNQLEFGNERVEMARFDIAELITGLIQSSSLLAAQKGITIAFANSGPVYVWGEEFKVEEVLTNYLTNAMNHAGGEKQIEIGIEQRKDVARISVFNTGEQIPAEELDKIWIKFYKVDKARTREYGGSGIGLSIVKAIMDSFHQACGVINRENGVEFWIELENN
ncbi:MAG: HAMP domain-containing histidine kinase [Muribaculaceae bacterium]|nr:HAMP domain-containing histidine kinase [Roseburia sp.]MCM1431129.1 HAMP domain-containing histidine kinase [Muribaculaceae bacterium]MCM1492552.1 HAMP domain-containing histidine kinase [Muribaculaceae bacterium]